MRKILVLASAALASAVLPAGIAAAGDQLHVTPPILREQAWASQRARPASELTVTPQPVRPASAGSRVSTADRVITEAAATIR